MIICEKEKWIFIRNPKTASRSVAEFLLKNFECFELNEKHHYVKVPKKYKDFLVYVVIRNPLSRAVSAWKHIVLEQILFKIEPPRLTLPEYIKRQGFSGPEKFNFYLQSDLVKFIRQNHELRIMKFETLKNDLLANFNKDDQLKVIGKTEGDDWFNYYDEKTLDIAYNNLHEDFVNFDYPKSIPKLFL